MGATLQIVIIPFFLLTAVVLATLFADLEFGVILASAVVLGILYSAVVLLLRRLHADDDDAPGPGEKRSRL